MKMPFSKILSEIKSYWTGRSPGYAEINRHELATKQREKWKEYLAREISESFPERDPADLHALDVGTGPGFFAILLQELGLRVTAIDLTPAMLKEAKKNAGRQVKNIAFMEMNAQELSFADDSFDVVISRNLTWNLPDPEQAYAEWTRVLRKDGLLLNFDANWYAYLFDEKALAAYETDRSNSALNGVPDRNIGENFDVMEDIARRVPLSRIRRPEWDLATLGRLGVSAQADESVWEKVWSREEMLNFSSTPMFVVRAAGHRST